MRAIVQGLHLHLEVTLQPTLGGGLMSKSKQFGTYFMDCQKHAHSTPFPSSVI